MTRTEPRSSFPEPVSCNCQLRSRLGVTGVAGGRSSRMDIGVTSVFGNGNALVRQMIGHIETLERPVAAGSTSDVAGQRSVQDGRSRRDVQELPFGQSLQDVA